MLNVEVLQVLRGRERRGLIDGARSREAMEDLVDLPITRFPTLRLIARAWALRQNFSAYDAVYVALAEALGTAVVTADQHLARAVRDHSAAGSVLLEAE